MEPYATNPPDQGSRLGLLLNTLIGGSMLVSLIFIFLLIAGYGTVHFTGIPAQASLRINGVEVHTSTLKLRAGDYQLSLASPATDPLQRTLHVGVLQSVTFHPALTRRSPNAIASTAIGAANETSSAPQFSQVNWFQGNTWIAGRLTASGAPLAVHYDATTKQWTVAFYMANGYPQDPAVLPSDVAAYLRQIGGIV